MTTPPPEDLAAVLEQVIRRVPGVTTLYPPGGWWGTAVRGFGAALGLVAPAQMVSVSRLPDGSLDVSASIATGERASDVCRAVYDAVAEHLRGRGYGSGQVHVTVVQVTGDVSRLEPLA